MSMEVRLKTEQELADEEAARAADRLKVASEINEILDLLNPTPGRYAVELTLMTPDGPKAYNVSPLFTALAAQHQHFFNHCSDQHTFEMSPSVTFFPDAVTEKEGEELVKRHYHFDCIHRHVRMVLTFATVLMGKDGPTTVGQPRYETEYLYTGDPHTGDTDNYTWRAVVNWVIARFNKRQYVHLYGHNFQYIWDGEAKESNLIPDQ